MTGFRHIGTDPRPAGHPAGAGVSFPLRAGAGGMVAWSSGIENIRECIRVILLTEPGERVMLPAFGAGLSSFLMRPNTVATRELLRARAQRAIERWEPRIRLSSVTVETVAGEPDAAVLTVAFVVPADGGSGSVGVGLRFAPAGGGPAA